MYNFCYSLYCRADFVINYR